MQKITKILIQYVHTFSCTGELPAKMAGIPWPKTKFWFASYLWGSSNSSFFFGLLPINIVGNTYTAIHRDCGANFWAKFSRIQQGKYMVHAIAQLCDCLWQARSIGCSWTPSFFYPSCRPGQTKTAFNCGRDCSRRFITSPTRIELAGGSNPPRLSSISPHSIVARDCALRQPITRLCCRLSPVRTELAGGLNTRGYRRQVHIQLRPGIEPWFLDALDGMKHNFNE